MPVILPLRKFPARSSKRGGDLEAEMQELRGDLEAVRFAPGRADHSDTVVDLDRLRSHAV